MIKGRLGRLDGPFPFSGSRFGQAEASFQVVDATLELFDYLEIPQPLLELLLQFGQALKSFPGGRQYFALQGIIQA